MEMIKEKAKARLGRVQLCTKFSDTSGCRFGDSCHFKPDRQKARHESLCLLVAKAATIDPSAQWCQQSIGKSKPRRDRPRKVRLKEGLLLAVSLRGRPRFRLRQKV